MSWEIEYDPEALKDLRKLDRSIQKEILDYMDQMGCRFRGSAQVWQASSRK